jgi:rod shape-determining protein MreD
MLKSSLWLLILVTLILEVSVFSRFEIWGVRPDAILIVLVYVALGLGPIAGALLGFLMGLAQLSILTTSMASVPLAATIVGFVVGKYGTKVMYESYLVQFLIIVTGVLMFDTINFACSSPARLPVAILRFSIAGGLYTAALGVLLVIVIERIVGLRLVT